ncbi:MAG: metallophosphoesterase family protein [Candidatus Nanohaloarchaea archaeon]|nr:metallophosphoesterase family protein [Candidatus Nanohaloarchaea archaeon]
MAFDPDPERSAAEDHAHDYLVVSDLHLDWGEDGQDDIEYATTVANHLERYGEEHGCDGLLIAGDIGEPDDVEDLYDDVKEAFDEVLIAQGNHDVLARDIAERVNHVPTDDYDQAVRTEVDGLLLEMQHDPSDFNLNYKKQQSSSSAHGEPDIVVYGHSHMPFDRALSDGTLAIGAGSTFDNYNMQDHMPSTSFHVLSSDDDHVTVEHHDFWSGEKVEEAVYRYGPDGFEEVFSDWEWDAAARDEERWTIPS